jgi:multicomponent K+:H+ antiporter subunit G
MVLEGLVSVLLLIGAGFTLVGSVGLVRLPDFYARLHGPTKATTLGVGATLLASVIHFSATGGWSLHELLVIAFLFLTAPVSAHLMAKAALYREEADGSGSSSSSSSSSSGSAGGL